MTVVTIRFRVVEEPPELERLLGGFTGEPAVVPAFKLDGVFMTRPGVYWRVRWVEGREVTAESVDGHLLTLLGPDAEDMRRYIETVL